MKAGIKYNFYSIASRLCNLVMEILQNENPWAEFIYLGCEIKV